MDEFTSEKEQIEALRQWWKENGTFVVTGLVLGLGLLGGWKYWNDYKTRQAETASVRYEQLLRVINTGNGDEAADLAQRIYDEYFSTPYAAQAALAMARLHIGRDEAAEAEKHLRNVLENSKDKQLRLVARLRLARVLIYQDKGQEALTVLDAVEPGSFAARYHEVRGDAWVALGDHAQARSEYRQALDKSEPGLVDRSLLEMKLNDLAMTGSVTEPGA